MPKMRMAYSIRIHWAATSRYHYISTYVKEATPHNLKLKVGNHISGQNLGTFRKDATQKTITWPWSRGNFDRPITGTPEEQNFALILFISYRIDESYCHEPLRAPVLVDYWVTRPLASSDSYFCHWISSWFNIPPMMCIPTNGSSNLDSWWVVENW